MHVPAIQNLDKRSDRNSYQVLVEFRISYAIVAALMQSGSFMYSVTGETQALTKSS